MPTLAPALRRTRSTVLAAVPVLALAACGPRVALTPPAPATASPTAPAPDSSLRERIAALSLRQTAFGAISVIPVRFERSRISKPFVDGGRTLYCVSTRMMGRNFGEPERPRIVVQERAGSLIPVDEDEEICHGHRTEPFPELDTPTAGKA